jgi:thiamine-monophosphate kinase
MKLSEIGEFGLIDRFSPHFTRGLPENVHGIGDDCAIIPLNKKESQLITTDMLIEESHFLINKISPEDLGYKSLAVNLSDIAAMGGIPVSAFLSIGIPTEIEVEWLDRFFAGINELARQTNVFLLGGDTTQSKKHLIINIVVLGKIETSHIKYRSGAVPGDIVCLTGSVGDSGGGLQIILEDKQLDQEAKLLIEAHHRPRPHIEEGRWLGKSKHVHAMMDVSDGIDSDLCRIMEQSECGVHVQLDKLPVSPQLTAVCSHYGWNRYELAAAGGEDYCLVCTIDAPHSEEVTREFEKQFGHTLYPIGHITGQAQQLIYYLHQEQMTLTKHGFNHFA